MTTIQNTVKAGSVIAYDDGRDGHRGVKATVLVTDASGMLVQFEDRADTTRIQFSDLAWMNHITVAQ